MVHLVMTLGYNLILVNPYVAITGQNVDVRFRFPVGMGLASVRIAKGDVYSGKFFILQQNSDHFRQAKVCSERQLAYAVAVLVGMAILPKFLFQIFARALHVY